MMRATMVLVSLMGIALAGATVARADHWSSGYGRSCGPSFGFSSQSYGGVQRKRIRRVRT